MTDPDPDPDTTEAAIRARRQLTNSLIADHNALGLAQHMTMDMLLIVGDGDLLDGARAVIEAFTAQFADPDFVAYVRTTQTVELAHDGARAAETGRWVGTWKGRAPMSGTYLASWRRLGPNWMIEREMYVTLAR
jgi:ketosteroid isomerase-like protein